MTCRGCILIDNEYDRINYLITFCLKNYYINQANMIEDGKFIPKWRHEHELEQEKGKDRINDVSVLINGHRYNVI